MTPRDVVLKFWPGAVLASRHERWRTCYRVRLRWEPRVYGGPTWCTTRERAWEAAVARMLHWGLKESDVDPETWVKLHHRKAVVVQGAPRRFRIETPGLCLSWCGRWSTTEDEAWKEAAKHTSTMRSTTQEKGKPSPPGA